NSAKLTPRPSQVAPSGNGMPSCTRDLRTTCGACGAVLARGSAGASIFMGLRRGRGAGRVRTLRAEKGSRRATHIGATGSTAAEAFGRPYSAANPRLYFRLRLSGACQAAKSDTSAGLAQLVEHLICNQG